MTTGNADFDRLFKKVVDAVNTPEEDYPWVNRPVQPITEPWKSTDTEVPVVLPPRNGLEVHFPAPSEVESVISGFHSRLSSV